MRRAVVGLLVIVAAVLFIVDAGFIVLTHTNFGRDRARRVVLGLIRDKVHGDVTIGRIEGNLAGRFSLVDVTIADRPGKPFLSAARITATMGLQTIFSKRIDIRDLTLERPVVRLVKDSSEHWNFERIFPRNKTTVADTMRGFGSWIALHNLAVRDGSITVEEPWAPDSSLRGAARDSAVKAILGDAARTRVERVDGALVETMDFSAINGLFPRVLLANPDSNAIVVDVERMSMIAAPFRPPPFDIRDFRGTLRIVGDTLTIPKFALRFPNTSLTGSLSYNLARDNIHLEARGNPVSFADLRGFYPTLPDSGGGTMDLVAQLGGPKGSDYVLREADIHIGAARIEGKVGIAVDSTTTFFHDTDVRVTQLPTSLIERLSATKLPASGVFSGRAQIAGPFENMLINVNGTFDPTRHPAFHFVARGGLAAMPDVRMRDLHVHVDALPVSFVREFSPKLPMGGAVTADATLSGAPAKSVNGTFNLTHVESGVVSRVAGAGSVAMGKEMQVNAVAHFAPLSLALVRDFAPNATVVGDVSGTVRVRGSMSNLETHADLRLPGNGILHGDGTLGLTAVPSYNMRFELQQVDFHAFLPASPLTTINGVASVAGAGTDPATLRATVTADLREIVVDSTKVQVAAISANARDGALRVDSLLVRAPWAAVTARGDFGLVAGRTGRLAYTVDLKDLNGLGRWIASGDTVLVPPRPGVRQRLARMVAQTDSMRQAQLADTVSIATLATGKGVSQPPKLPPTPVPEVPPIRRDSLAGSVRITGDVNGYLRRFTARGRALTSGVVYNGNEIGRGRIDFTYADGGTPDATLSAEAGLDSLRAVGFAFDSTHIKGRYHGGEGNVEVSIFPGDTAVYRVRADYALRTREGEVWLRDVNLQLDTITTWVSQGQSRISWKGSSLAIEKFELRTPKGPSRLYVNGTLPDGTPANLEVQIDSLAVAPWMTLLQSDIPLSGVLSFHARLGGTRAIPVFSGSLALTHTTYRKAPFPEIHTSFDYDQRRLLVDGDLRRAGGVVPPLAKFHGTAPVDIAFDGSAENRIVDAPITVDVSGDSIPLSPLQQLVSAFSVITGEARGSIGLRGTLANPRFTGALDIRMPQVGFVATGVTYGNAITHIHMDGETLVVDSLVARSAGTIRAGGTVKLANLAHPVVDLRVQSNGARVLDNEYGELFMDARLTMRGPIDSMNLRGASTITRGVIYLPDPEKLKVISTGDPAVLAVTDSTLARELGIEPEASVLTGMDADVTVAVNRGTWARSRDANVEVYGNVRVQHDPFRQENALTGTLFTDQGEYTLYGHRFNVTRGSVRFVGDPTINPNLQVTAQYQVRQAGRAPFDINVIIGGTMRRPTLELHSDAQPTLSQSDLLSFLAFGQSSTSLLQFQGSGLVAGGQAGSSLAGNVAALATRQLASVALGALTDEAKASIVHATRADVVDITPADLPADMSLGGFGNVLRGTEIRIGKYTDHRTFVMTQIRPTAAIPGAYIERRYGERFRFRTSFETRYQPPRPSLSASQTPTNMKVFGALLSWSLHW